MKNFIKEYINNDIKLTKKEYVSVFALVCVIAGVFGFTYEFIFYFFNSGMKSFYWRGANFLPWINIYATGSFLIYFLSYKHRKKPLKVFLISLISTGVLEYIAGYLMFKFGNGLRCWDYNTEILNFLNIDGFVCLRSVLFFGLSGLILIYLIIPFCIYLCKKFNSKKFYTFCIILVSIFLFDEHVIHSNS